MAMRSEPKSRKRREVELLRMEKVRRSEHKHTANISVQLRILKKMVSPKTIPLLVIPGKMSKRIVESLDLRGLSRVGTPD